jgi:hypothetical protein
MALRTARRTTATGGRRIAFCALRITRLSITLTETASSGRVTAYALFAITACTRLGGLGCGIAISLTGIGASRLGFIGRCRLRGHGTLARRTALF